MKRGDRIGGREGEGIERKGREERRKLNRSDWNERKGEERGREGGKEKGKG